MHKITKKNTEQIPFRADLTKIFFLSVENFLDKIQQGIGLHVWIRATHPSVEKYQTK